MSLPQSGKLTQGPQCFACGETCRGSYASSSTPARVPQDAKSLAFIRIRKGDETARWAVSSWETLSRGFPMRREAAFVQAAAGKRVLRKNDIRSFRVRIRRTRAAIFQKATLATAAGGGRREQGLAPRSATGEAACPPMTEPGTARGSQGFAFIRIRKGDETLSRGFPMRRIVPHFCNRFIWQTILACLLRGDMRHLYRFYIVSDHVYLGNT